MKLFTVNNNYLLLIKLFTFNRYYSQLIGKFTSNYYFPLINLKNAIESY